MTRQPFCCHGSLVVNIIGRRQAKATLESAVGGGAERACAFPQGSRAAFRSQRVTTSTPTSPASRHSAHRHVVAGDARSGRSGRPGSVLPDPPDAASRAFGSKRRKRGGQASVERGGTECSSRGFLGILRLFARPPRRTSPTYQRQAGCDPSSCKPTPSTRRHTLSILKQRTYANQIR